MSSLLNDKDYVASLEKGLLVLNLFNEKNRKITLSETANLLDMTRATARRFLKTLEILGYLDSDSKYYWLTPKILKLSKAYLTSNSFHKIAQYYVKLIALKTEETSYISVKNGSLSTVIACEQASRKMQVNVQIGDGEPLLGSASGRVFLSQMQGEDLVKYIKNSDLTYYNEYTILDPDLLYKEVQKIKSQGYCFVNQEQEKSLVSLAVPLRNLQGELIATLSIIGTDSRFHEADIIRKLEYMFQIADEIKNNMIL
ncbi:IclR family transcriptional regulator C-terminal domain-containing protein [Acinetobacter sp. YH01012]|nr:IclR family transcriptional regulator C-terminal domain-containing protein [Acinetobacter sp. YH01012]